MHSPDPIPALVCGHCGDPVYRAGRLYRHGLQCGAKMPNAKDRCARIKGHGYNHRSAYAMSNERR